MKLLSMTAVALLIDISVSFTVIDDNQTFQNEPKLPILNDKFQMTCYSNQVYLAHEIKQFSEIAYREKNNVGLESGSFTRFPAVTVYKYLIGEHYVPELGYAHHYVLIDNVGLFLAGMLEYPTNEGTAYAACKFSKHTRYESYQDSRQLHTQDDQVYDVSRHGQHHQQPPIGHGRQRPGQSSKERPGQSSRERGGWWN
ncbi:putative candidate secreted effector protein [Blumeria hordei DH14]|uniref:Putative candidate secreted effector protein n=1 Tax=Blumeria graminis f. sp. hordei (strain DH14) TaxID=546991 RepID=N1JA46_BLUG1|nr:putative candidate secreted effector protein [Blumeria hordei DH14]